MMIAKELPTTGAEYEAHAAEILRCEPYLARLSATADWAEQFAVAANHHYLISNGMTESAYEVLFTTCLTTGDFSPLRKALLTSQKKNFAAQLKKPETENGAHDRLRRALQTTNEQLGTLASAPQKEPLARIGVPALFELPGWLSAINQQRMPVREVIRYLKDAAADATNGKPAGDASVTGVAAQVHRDAQRRTSSNTN